MADISDGMLYMRHGGRPCVGGCNHFRGLLFHGTITESFDAGCEYFYSDASVSSILAAYSCGEVMTESNTLLEIKDLRTYFHTEGGTVKAVENLNLTMKAGQTLGIVGESGSGKSVISFHHAPVTRFGFFD